VTVVALMVRTRHGQGSAARREAPWWRPAHAAQAPERSAIGSIQPARESLRDQLARALGLQRRTTPRRRPPGLDDIDDDLSRSCGRRHVYAAETPSYQALSADDFR
jgi:hypothetical protein